MNKKDRFDIFKRDGFKCIYCGRTPPGIVLEIDHIFPKSRGGSKEPYNLVTSCLECNRGKRDIPLTVIPNSLIENLELLKEKQKQVYEYENFMASIKRTEDHKIRKIDAIYTSYFPEFCLSTLFKEGSLRKFIRLMTIQDITEAMVIACERTGSEEAPAYFCGICWNKIKGPKRKRNKKWRGRP